MRHLLIGVGCMLAATVAATARAESGFAGLERGAHAVGLQIVQQYDYSRVYKTRTDLLTGTATAGEVARPIQPLYVRTEASDEVFDRPRQEIDARRLKALN